MTCLSQKKYSIFFDEISVGLIKSDITFIKFDNSNTYASNQLGIGLGFYKVWKKDKTFNFIMGFEYNLINYETIIETQVQFGSNFIDYNIVSKIKNSAHTISLPFLIRLNVNRANKVFIESGPIVDFFNLTTEKSESDYTIIDKAEIDIKHPENFQLNYSIQKLTSTYGLQAAFGFNLPFAQKNIFAKASFQYRLPYSGTNFCCQKTTLNTIKISLGLNL
jgi:hypothetical protein